MDVSERVTKAARLLYYDYSTSYAGPGFVEMQNVNTSDYRNSYHNVELVGEKRFSRGWQLLGAFLATKRDVWIAGIPDTPNVLFPKDQTWTRQLTLSGSYEAPFGIQLSSVFEHRQGDAYARTVRFTSGLTQLTSVTLRAEPVGSQRLPTANLWSIRVAKYLEVRGGRFGLQVDLYNALNVNPATAIVAQSGSTYGKITGIVPPRIARLGLNYRF